MQAGGRGAPAALTLICWVKGSALTTIGLYQLPDSGAGSGAAAKHAVFCR